MCPLLPILGFTIILFALINFYFRLADHWNIIDKPNERSSHSTLVLRGGGIIFPLGVLIWFFWSGEMYPWFVTGLMIISIISFMDDIKPTQVLLRLAIHFTAMILLLVQLDMISYPWWVWILALVLFTGIINAYNFMDGINGITVGYSLSLILGLGLAYFRIDPFVDLSLIFAVLILLIVFGFYNFRQQARCFAGDVGSVSISFILLFLLSSLIMTTLNPVYIMFVSVYGIDCIFTILQRLMQGENIFQAHRKHLYQVLANEKKQSHVSVSLLYTILQGLINVAVVILAMIFPVGIQWLISAALLILLSLLYLTIKKRLSRNLL